VLTGAVAVLRANLRAQLKAGEVADWDGMEVTGPVESTDLRGRTWFRFEATVVSRRSQLLLPLLADGSLAADYGLRRVADWSTTPGSGNQ
jgi:hypothetical protein